MTRRGEGVPSNGERPRLSVTGTRHLVWIPATPRAVPRTRETVPAGAEPGRFALAGSRHVFLASYDGLATGSWVSVAGGGDRRSGTKDARREDGHVTSEPGDDGLVPLGTGPTATVFAGMEPDGREAYALKVFPGPLDRRTRGEVEREIARLAELRGRAPVLVADDVRELPDGRCALRMELCTQSLPELIDSFGPLEVTPALALGIALAGALDEAHQAGLVHGGVGPGNVLFRAEGQPVLADFGRTLRRAFPPEASEVTAPETIRDGSADERSDLYGLGVILHLALSGRTPYAGRPGEPSEERVLRVLAAPVPRLGRSGLPPGLAGLVAELLSKDPADRPARAATVIERLAALHTVAARDELGASDMPEAVAEDAATSETPPPIEAPADLTAPDHAPAEQGHTLGVQILEFTPEDRRRGRRRTPWVPVAIGGFALLAVAALLILLDRTDELTVPRPPARAGATTPAEAPTPARAVRLELLKVRDRGDYVELAWRSSRPLDYGVVVAEEGEKAKVEMVRRRTSLRLPIDPVRKYCFQVQGSDGTRVYESSAKPIRGATCRP